MRQFHASAYGGDDLVIDDPRGIAAVKLAFKDEDGRGDDDELTVFGVNGGRGEIIYNPSLVRLARYGSTGAPSLDLVDPVGVAADADGLVVVADRGADRVVTLLVDPSTRLRYAKSIALANTSRPLRRPTGVAIAAGRVYVADGGNDRVVVVDTAGVDGTLLGVFTGGEAGLVSPFDVDVIDGPEFNYHDEAFMVVSDRDGARLSRLDLDGGAIASVSYAGVTGGAGGFDYVAIDYYGNVFVTDSRTECVHKFTRDLEPLARWECAGTAGGELDQPRGIVVHRPLGQVFIAERTGVSYYWIGTDVTGLRARVSRLPHSAGEPLEVQVRFVLTERSDVTVEVVDASGAPVVALAATRLPPGRKELSYEVDTRDLPCSVAECTYRVVVRARATYASRNHLEASRSALLRVPRR